MEDQNKKSYSCLLIFVEFFLWDLKHSDYKDEFDFTELNTILEQKIKLTNIYPEKSLIFNAFNLCPFNKIKVVVIGLEPYINKFSNGLTFSVKPDSKIPASLNNIYKELFNDLHITNTTGDLTKWAKQGVLLLNTRLTVDDSSKHTFWKSFIDNVIQLINAKHKHIIYILFGNIAHSKEKLIDSKNNLVIKLAHPSPNMTYKSKFPLIGSKCFSKSNKYLKLKNKDPINWKIF